MKAPSASRQRNFWDRAELGGHAGGLRFLDGSVATEPAMEAERFVVDANQLGGDGSFRETTFDNETIGIRLGEREPARVQCE